MAHVILKNYLFCIFFCTISIHGMQSSSTQSLCEKASIYAITKESLVFFDPEGPAHKISFSLPSYNKLCFLSRSNTLAIHNPDTLEHECNIQLPTLSCDSYRVARYHNETSILYLTRHSFNSIYMLPIHKTADDTKFRIINPISVSTNHHCLISDVAPIDSTHMLTTSWDKTAHHIDLQRSQAIIRTFQLKKRRL